MAKHFRWFTLACWLLCGIAVAQEGNSQAVRSTKVKDAIAAEVPLAKKHLKNHPAAAKVTEELLTNKDVLTSADATLSQVKKTGLFSGKGVSLDGTLISITAFPLTADRWEDSLRTFRDTQFSSICDHYKKQAEKSAALDKRETAHFVHIYLGVRVDGSVVAAIGVSDAGNKTPLPPRQFPAAIKNIAIALKDLPAKSCDIDTMGEKVLPGEGYLLTPDQVAKSDAYFASLDPKTRLVMKKVVESDTSPWLISEKHIGKFKVDKQKARQLAVELWEKEASGKK